MATKEAVVDPRFLPREVKIGEDTYTIIWEPSLERFDLRKNNAFLGSSVNSDDCVYQAKQKGVEFPPVVMPKTAMGK